jgi:hypothetical protein
LITNDLIDLGATINALEMLELQGILRKPPIFIQMDNRSIVKPKGMLYGIIVSIDSWEYPIDFMVLQTKSRLGGYHLIMVRIWLENVDAYIGCKSGDMTISNGHNHKQLALYPLSKPFLEATKPIWIDDEENNTFYEDSTINRYLIKSNSNNCICLIDVPTTSLSNPSTMEI